MANPTIGRIRCPITKEWAEVRKYNTGTRKLYLVSSAGMITPNSASGQAWMLENAEIWGENGKPPEDPKPVNGKSDEKPPVNEKPAKKSWLESFLSEDD